MFIHIICSNNNITKIHKNYTAKFENYDNLIFDVNGDILATEYDIIVVKYIIHYLELIDENEHNALSYIDNINDSLFIDLILASNYLGINHLVNYLSVKCRSLLNLI